ncbi:hypothetical protein, partial [Burkholderia pseudomallei]
QHHAIKKQKPRTWRGFVSNLRGGNPPLWLKQLANDLGSPCSYFSLVRPTGYVPTVLLPE